MDLSAKIAVTGAAGLVGQNLLPRLKARGYTNLVAIDKHRANLAILHRLHPDIMALEVDLATDNGWEGVLDDVAVVIVSHAQIGGLDASAFTANNVTATERLIDAVRQSAPYLVHLSSSVVKSAAHDWHTESKEAGENLVLASGLPAVVLRPTLMFGWFDRKHLGWLARFMQRSPVFPIPGDGLARMIANQIHAVGPRLRVHQHDRRADPVEQGGKRGFRRSNASSVNRIWPTLRQRVASYRLSRSIESLREYENASFRTREMPPPACERFCAGDPGNQPLSLDIKTSIH
jgi:uncharacterized protein YbjT (DUF2867 family)